MKYLFSEWKKALDEFQKSVDKTVEEIRKEKVAVQHMKEGYFSAVDNCHYIHDDRRIVLSAPEIIIGNVDSNGVLVGNSSIITLRGSDINIEATGAAAGSGLGGSITNRASSIRSIAVDPGIDGVENVVMARSQIVSQARAIVLQSSEGAGTFMEDTMSGVQGISLSSDTVINMDALSSVENTTEALEKSIKAADTQVSDFESDMKTRRTTLNKIFDDLEKLGQEEEGYLGGDKKVCSKYRDIADVHRRMEALSVDAANAMNSYVRAVSLLAEAKSRKKALEENKKTLDGKKDKFKTETTGNSISLRSESFSFKSSDGDGNDRTNPEASFAVSAQNIRLESVGKDNSLMKQGTINLKAMEIDMSTADIKVDKDGKSAESPAAGKVNVVSKEINLEAVDYSYKDGKQEEKELSEQGKISMRAKDIQAMSTDTEGKAAGNLSLNAKHIEIKSMDVDKEKKTDSALAKDGATVIVSEKLFVGSKDSNTKSNQLQISSDKVGVFAKTAAELQQDSALVQLKSGKATISSGGNTIHGKTDIKDAVTAPSATIEHLEAKSSFKSKTISDGVAVSGGGGSSAKGDLKEEDAPKAEGGK